MRRAGRIVGWVILGLAVSVAAVWSFAPREPVDLTIRFDPAGLPADLDGYLAATESAMGGVRPGVEKRILWAGGRGQRTGWAVVYLHGFSATSEEIRPVPDRVAQGLDANLYFARLAGHGLPGDRMAGVTVQDWMDDTAEALAICGRIGERCLVIATSTGATLMAEAALHPDLRDRIDAIAMVSPNFGIARPGAWTLDLPLARWWLPLVAGGRLTFPAKSPDHARFWTLDYPLAALYPMAALVRHARNLDFAKADTPLLVVSSDADQVVDTARIPDVVAAWGGPVAHQLVRPGPGDDPAGHIIAGDILSPAKTGPVAAMILDWVRGL